AGANASYGSLSPDGLSLLYWREFDGNAEVVIADAHGRGERRLTHNMNFDGWPSWSPDGRMIAFSRDNGVSADIVVLELASGAEQVLTSGPGRRISPKWDAAGGLIYFGGVVDGARGIWRINVSPAGR
ncbi:MAG: PD40 domain-containing protein, partial [Hyphomonadaceae bacterium]|nr:PD40 domain-containing protein [Hyphomonadaceae bacterium]